LPLGLLCIFQTHKSHDVIYNGLDIYFPAMLNYFEFFVCCFVLSVFATLVHTACRAAFVPTQHMSLTDAPFQW
jgi:uncharacterized membrane protein (DUF106 family)